MSRVEHIGLATLHLGDALEILPTLGKVDHVITDPPYAANTHKQAKTNRGKGWGTQLVDFAHLTDEAFDNIAEMCLTAADAWVVMTCDYRHAARMYDHERFVRLGVWVKPNPMPQISGDRPGQGFETVLIMHAGGRRKEWHRGGGSGVWTYPICSGAEVSTQKPLRLVRAFLADFTAPGETILDPFTGGGTTGTAAVLMGRKFVGVEIDPVRFDIACRRIEDAQRQGDMFIESAA